MEIVTGYTGQPHVTSDDVRAFNAGIIGKGKYVLDTGNRLEANKTSSDSLVILDGDIVMNGCHARISTQEEMNLTPGTDGVKRKDLIVARYTRQGGVESVSLIAVEGTPATKNPSVPTTPYQDNNILNGDTTVDMVLYVVTFDEYDIVTIEQKYKIQNNLNKTYSRTEVDEIIGNEEAVFNAKLDNIVLEMENMKTFPTNQEIVIGTAGNKQLFKTIITPPDKSLDAGVTWTSSIVLPNVQRIISATVTCSVYSQEVASYLYGESVPDKWGGVLVTLPFLTTSGKRIDCTIGMQQTDEVGVVGVNNLIINPTITNKLGESVELKAISIEIEYTRN